MDGDRVGVGLCVSGSPRCESQTREESSFVEHCLQGTAHASTGLNPNQSPPPNTTTGRATLGGGAERLVGRLENWLGVWLRCDMK
jgi:hypothetical protein